MVEVPVKEPEVMVREFAPPGGKFVAESLSFAAKCAVVKRALTSKLIPVDGPSAADVVKGEP